MKWHKILKRWIIYRLFKCFEFIVYLLPFSTAVWWGGRLGFFAYYILDKERNISLTNLKISFPEKKSREIRKIAKEVFINEGKNFCELLSFSKLSKDKVLDLVEAEGLEYLDQALSEGNGILYLTAHLGNWELMGAYLSCKGYPINVIARRVYDDRLNEILVGLRKSKGVKTILRDESPKGILRSLKQKEVIGILIDQDTSRVQGVFVDFFGRLAYTPVGIATLAKRENVVVLPGFIVRKDRKHCVYINKPVKLIKKENREEEVRENTQKLTKIIESWIRSYPQQWVWMHKRWKRKPVV